jgi:Zn-dependent membrane protease YugP
MSRPITAAVLGPAIALPAKTNVSARAKKKLFLKNITLSYELKSA